ncbi:RING finger and transmembrane domain-containing protein 2 [Anabrus simplex]|uniref:RING finger and transmembrane domain-containing protein 2 n=1 Tax=Anabrus simplex TaxID=316456 RepID=UPI0035A30C0E
MKTCTKYGVDNLMARAEPTEPGGVQVIRSGGFFPVLSYHRPNQHGLLMTHTVTTSIAPNPTNTGPSGGVNIGRHTAEGSRMLHNNLVSVIEELRPFVELVRADENAGGLTLPSWVRQTPPSNMPTTTAPTASDSFVITLESDGAQQGSSSNSTNNHLHGHHHSTGTTNNSSTENFLNNVREASGTDQNHQHNNNNNNNNNVEEGAAELLRQSPETRAFLAILYKYVPFFLILLAKGIYDHRAGILIFIGLFVTFSHANSVVTREIAKQGRRSLTSLLIIVCNLMGCILFIYYIFQDQKLYLSLVFIPPYSQPLSVWDLLWIVGVTDFVLKLVTIILKVSVAALPAVVLPYQRRGKCYLFLEATSQLYRSLAPIQPWLYYLLESYQGPEKVVGVFLSAAYMVSKGTDLMSKGKLWRNAFWKLLQNMNLGVSPNKDQLHLAGNQCPICHDEYETPVLLHCRHIFCEACVATWFDRVQTCPLCRAKVVDDPSWRDGTTTYFTQLY